MVVNFGTVAVIEVIWGSCSLSYDTKKVGRKIKWPLYSV